MSLFLQTSNHAVDSKFEKKLNISMKIEPDRLGGFLYEEGLVPYAEMAKLSWSDLKIKRPFAKNFWRVDVA